jgi:hypothetical protein
VKQEQANRHQQTLPQCFYPPFDPPVDPPPAKASGYRCINIDGQQYLLNDTTNHLLVVPPASQANKNVSEKARSMNPLNLARDSFEVTPSVRMVPSKMTATAQASTNFVLSENIGSGSEDKIIYVQKLHKKKRKPAPLPESSQEVKVKSQDLPKTCNFADYGNYRASAQELDSGSNTNVDRNSNDKWSNQSVNFLEED